MISFSLTNQPAELHSAAGQIGGLVGLRDDALLRGELNALTPRLRRYARALVTGHAAPSELADDLVHATLIRALGARHIGGTADLRVRLYATVTQLHREMALSTQQARAAGSGRPTINSSLGRASAPPMSPATSPPTALAGALLALPLESREAILLAGLESLSYSDAARVLRISRPVLMSRLTQGRHALEHSLRPDPGFVGERMGQSRGKASHLRLVT